MNTWISISDGLGPSIFTWKGRVPWGKRWMQKLFISRQGRHSHFNLLVMSVLFPVFTLTRRVKNYVSRHTKVWMREIKYQKTQFFASTDDNNQYNFVFSRHVLKLLKQFDFPS